MLRRWTVSFGPEFAESKKACRASPGRMKLHLAALELNLERDPFHNSEAYGEPTHRVMETRDHFDDGFVLSAFIVIDVEHFDVEVKWIDMRPLPDDDDEDDVPV